MRFLLGFLLSWPVLLFAVGCQVKHHTADVSCGSFRKVDGVVPPVTVSCDEAPAPHPDSAPDLDPTPDPDPVPPGAEPYDLSGFSIPFAYSWPQVPSTSRVINVTTFGQFRNAVNRSGVRVIVAAGEYNGDLHIRGDDIDVVMSNDANLNGGISIFQRQRIRWTGGNVLNGGRVMTWRAVSDVLFNNVYIEGTLAFHRIVDGPGSHRLAFVNTTVNGAVGPEQFSIWSSPGSAQRHSDIIFANVKADNAVNSPFRIGWAERVIVVDSAFNTQISSSTGFRFNVGSDNTYVANTLIVGLIHLTFTGDQSTSVTNSLWENIIKYNTADANPAVFANAPIGVASGVVDSPIVFSEAGPPVGRLPNTRSLEGVNLTPIQAWDGATLPDVSGYGADH